MRFRWKVVLALLLAGLVPLGVIAKIEIDRLGKFAYAAAEASMQTQIELKGQAVEQYFLQVIQLSKTLAERPETAGALRSLGRTAGDIVEKADLVVDDAALAKRYEEQAKLTQGAAPDAAQTWIGGLDDVAKRLQQIFIFSNPEPLGDKDKLDVSPDGSAYSSLHRANHPIFRRFKEEFGFYDLFLIDPVEGRIVYSVEKELDYGTSLLTGPYAKSAFGASVKRMIADKGKTIPYILTDFEPYAPSYNEQAAFILVPVFDAKEFGGILAFQLPLDFANKLLGASADRLTTSDTYIIGLDRRLRSVPRFGENLKVGTVIEGDLMKLAVDKGVGVARMPDHLGMPVIAAFRPLQLQGVSWRIISQVAESEALASSIAARKQSFSAVGLAAGGILIFGLVLAQWLLRPIRRLGEEMKEQAAAAIDLLRTASEQARGAAETMATTAEQTSRQTQSVLTSAEHMNGDVTSVAAAVEELSTSIRNVVQGIVQTSDLVEDAAERADLARQMLAELELVATRITDIVTLINDVANQTNLLSLNAAIEASHAGAAGRGFAVVAAEIRKLAARTTESTEEIASEVRQVLSAVGRNADAIRGISERIDQVNDQARGISVAAGQQGDVTRDIADRMATTAGRVTFACSSLVQVHTASTEAATAANDVLDGVQLVERASSEMDDALSGFVRRVRAL
ncbi:MAG: chemotaxis protein [Rhodobacteraceae bacterium PARR1]|nr:MAG: chemotaxis protein [Rhodobacteraceae bacterium PARR1]